MNYTLAAPCVCGHEQDSHHDKADNCLAMYCTCRYFAKPGTRKKYALRAVDRDEAPETPRTEVNVNKPHADTTCQCKACNDWLLKRWGAGW